jgi:hypothetical protein
LPLAYCLSYLFPELQLKVLFVHRPGETLCSTKQFLGQRSVPWNVLLGRAKALDLDVLARSSATSGLNGAAMPLSSRITFIKHLLFYVGAQ